MREHTVYPKKYAHGFCFVVLCCGYTLTDFPISIRLTSLALWQSNDCPSASKATLVNMDKYFMWIHYERLHNHNKAKHNKTVCIFLGIYCILACILLEYLWAQSFIVFATRSCYNLSLRILYDVLWTKLSNVTLVTGIPTRFLGENTKGTNRLLTTLAMSSIVCVMTVLQ